MCGRYFFAENLANEEYLKLLERKYDQLVLDLWSRNEVYPGTLCVTETDSGAELMNWGLPLFSRNMINSRLESIMEKNYYRDIFHSGRCIIPASGFYEWDGHKQKHYIHTDEPIIYLAGISQPGKDFSAYSIITRPATQTAFIHDRAPVIMNRRQAMDYLKEVDPGILLSWDKEVRIESPLKTEQTTLEL